MPRITIAILFVPGFCLAQDLPPLSIYSGTFQQAGFSGDGGKATDALFYNPWAATVDSDGNLYVADSCNNRIRKIDPNGIITTVAGSGGNTSSTSCAFATGYSGDGGPATTAQLNQPKGVAVDSAGNIYISDAGNKVIRKVDTGGIITTFAGGGNDYPGDGGPATSAYLGNLLQNIAVDSLGNLYIPDGGSMVRKVTPDGIITTVAGNTFSGYAGDGGPATKAFLGIPTGVAVDPAGNLYIADTSNCVIRKVSDGIITTIAGNYDSCGLSSDSGGDGGPATSAQIAGPWGVAVDSAGNVYIADNTGHNVREVLASTGIITTLMKNGEKYIDNGAPSQFGIFSPTPYGIAVSGSTVYVPDSRLQVVWTLTANTF